MIGTVLFTIPIYRIDFDKWSSENKKKLERYIATMREPYDRIGAPVTQDIIRDWRPFFDSEHPIWPFNEVIGWLTLDLVHNDIIGNLWFSLAKRHSWRSRKRYAYRGDLFRVSLFFERDSQKIFESIVKWINLVAKEKPLASRWISLEGFLKIGPYINWGKLSNVNE